MPTGEAHSWILGVQVQQGDQAPGHLQCAGGCAWLCARARGGDFLRDAAQGGAGQRGGGALPGHQ